MVQRATTSMVSSPLPRSRVSSRNTSGGVISKSLPPIPLSKDPTALLDSLDNRSNRSSLGLGLGGATPSSFDPIDFLNKHYETEQSLALQLPALRESVASRMQVLNDRISNALQRQSETADSTRRHVQDAQASVIALERRILQVKEKASLSERAVLEITADMKRLDCAKKHLQRTITTLKRLHMLVHAVEQLRLTTLEQSFPDFKTASHLVDAINQLQQHFQAYTSKVQPMRVLATKVMQYEQALRLSLVAGFRVVAFGQEKAMLLEGKKILEDVEEGDHPNVEVMSVVVMQGGAALLDSLGDSSRERFIHDFCQDLLGDYLRDFEPPNHRAVAANKPEKRVSSFKVVVDVKSEPENLHAGLDHMDKRFSWFLNVPLNTINSKFAGVFPMQWNLQVTVARMFLQLSRDHILALLDGPYKDSDAGNASILVGALQKTIKFERDISGWLERECGAVFTSTNEKNGVDSHQDAQNVSSINPLIGIASSAYQSYMEPYIRLEEQRMDEQLVEALEDRTVDTRGERPVFISSTNLFVFIKGSITRCTVLTKGHAFYLLYLAFKDSLRKYCQILNGKLPPPIVSQGANVGGIVIAPFGGKQESTGPNASYRIPNDEEGTICQVISTCEYCADTMEALEDLIRDTIEEELKAKVDMVSDQEYFHEVTAKSIRVLVSGLANRIEVAFKIMVSINWGACDSVGEESAYVLSMHEEIEPFVKTVKKLLPTSYFRSFCDKFAAAFSSLYNENLIRLKRISEPGTQQLLLDVYNLKTLLLKLPVLEDDAMAGKKAGSTGPSIAPAMYTKTIHKHFGRMETILKLVGTPLELLIDNFKVQWPGGTSTDFAVVMTLKGMKRPEQASMLEKFGFDPAAALKGATAGVTSAALVSERVQQLQDQGSTVAAKVNSDLNQMRQKVDDFRKTFR